MPDTCWDKVDDALKATILPLTEAGKPLEGWNIVVNPSASISQSDEDKTIVLWPLPPELEQSEEQHQTLHRYTVDIEFIVGQTSSSVLTRTIRAAMAHVHAALAADRTLGGMLHYLQEEDIAPAVPEQADVHGASVQYIIEFYTARDDWFTIVGQGGASF